jgi:hypothetical protein
MADCIGSLLKGFDMLAPQPNLSISGQGSVKTMLGAILTVLNFAVLSGAIGIIFKDFFKTDNPVLSEEVLDTSIYPNMNMVKSKLVPVFFAYIDDITPLNNTELSRYLTLRYNRYTYTTNKDDPSLPPELNTTYLNVVPCRDLIDANRTHTMFTTNTGFLYDMMKKTGFCIDANESDIFVSGRQSDIVYDMLSFEVFPCSLPESECASLEDTKRISFLYTLPTMTTNFSNYKQPIGYSLSADEYYYINPGAAQRYQAKLLSGSIYDDRGIPLQGKTQRTNYNKIERIQNTLLYRESNQTHCSDSEFDDWTCRPYFIFEYVSGGKTVTLTRTYKSLLDTLGSVGGVKELIFLVFFYIYMYYNKRAKKLLMVAQVYKIKPMPTVDSALMKLKRRCCPCCIKKRQTAKYTTNTFDPNLNSPQGDSSFLPLGAEGIDQNATAKLGSQDSNPEDKQEQDDLCSAPKEVIDEAYQVIEQNLDLMTLAKEINHLKLLTHTLLTDYQMVLAPLVSLNVDLAKRKHQQQIQKKVEEAPTDREALLSLFGFIFKMQLENKTLATAYTELLSSAKSSPSEQQSPNEHTSDILSILWKQIDQECVTALENGGFFPFAKLRNLLTTRNSVAASKVPEVNLIAKLLQQTTQYNKDTSNLSSPLDRSPARSVAASTPLPLSQTLRIRYQPSDRNSTLAAPVQNPSPALPIPLPAQSMPPVTLPLSIFSPSFHDPSQPKSIPINPPSVRKQNPQYDNLY